MTDETTMHCFSSPQWLASVRQDVVTGNITIAIHPSEGEQWRLLRHFELVCQSSSAAAELSSVLRSASVMAQFLEEGGTVEHWRAKFKDCGPA